MSDEQEARKLASSTQLLSKQKFVELFPKANFYVEKVAGLSKSFIVYDGW